VEKFSLKLFILLFAGVLVLSGSVLLYLLLGGEKVTPESLRNDGFFLYDNPITLNPFELQDHNQNAFTNQSLGGHWSMVFFGYTYCPDICPLTMASLKQFHDLLERVGESVDVRVVMISVDPERDTLPKMKDYVTYFNPGFIGATGEYAQVLSLTKQVNISFSYTRIDDENYLVNHNGEIMLFDPQGNNVGFFKAPYQPENMLDNFRRVKTYFGY